MEDTDGTVCGICLDEVQEESIGSFPLECSHTFHSNCLIRWLRQGNLSCPCCRSDLHDAGECIPGYTLRERASYLRQFARRASAPRDLKRLVERVKKSEEKEREIAKNLSEWRRANKEVIKTQNKLIGMRHMARMRRRRLLNVLGLYESAEYQLPSLIVYQ